MNERMEQNDETEANGHENDELEIKWTNPQMRAHRRR